MQGNKSFCLLCWTFPHTSVHDICRGSSLLRALMYRLWVLLTHASPVGKCSEQAWPQFTQISTNIIKYSTGTRTCTFSHKSLSNSARVFSPSIWTMAARRHFYSVRRIHTLSIIIRIPTHKERSNSPSLASSTFSAR